MQELRMIFGRGTISTGHQCLFTNTVAELFIAHAALSAPPRSYVTANKLLICHFDGTFLH